MEKFEDSSIEYLNPNAFLQFPAKEEVEPWVSLKPQVENTLETSSPINSYSATLSPVESNLIFCDHVTLDSESLLFDSHETETLLLPHEVVKEEQRFNDDQVLLDPLQQEEVDGSTLIPDEDEYEYFQQEQPTTYTRNENGELEIPVRLSRRPTIYESFTKTKIDWCRYCGVTQRAQTAAFRPGPWGKRTLCNKHGCDYKGYGYIEKEPRLNLMPFIGESVKERIRPILQDWCAKCFQHNSVENNVLVQCDGCCRAYHQQCHEVGIPHDIAQGYTHEKWYCDPSCRENISTGRIAIEVPKRSLPLMKSTSRPQNSGKNSISSLSAYANTNPGSLAQEALNTIQKRKNSSCTIKVEVRKCTPLKEISKKVILVPNCEKMDKSITPRAKRHCNHKSQKDDLPELESISDECYEKRHQKYEIKEKEIRILS